MCSTCGCGNNTDVQQKAHTLRIEQDIMGENDRYAEKNRQFFQTNRNLVLNFVSSPGAGKTSLLVETIKALTKVMHLCVIEGDQHTDLDAKRIRQTKAPVIQINTGKSCHLDAHQITHAVNELALEPESVLLIENVGNLICPALFDLGETYKICLLSVPEGEDKPLKYPDMFHGGDIMLINKIDLLPYVDFNVERCIDYAKRINPKLKIFLVSVSKGTGMEDWYAWLQQEHSALLQTNTLS